MTGAPRVPGRLARFRRGRRCPETGGNVVKSKGDDVELARESRLLLPKRVKILMRRCGIGSDHGDVAFAREFVPAALECTYTPRRWSRRISTSGLLPQRRSSADSDAVESGGGRRLYRFVTSLPRDVARDQFPAAEICNLARRFGSGVGGVWWNGGSRVVVVVVKGSALMPCGR